MHAHVHLAVLGGCEQADVEIEVALELLAALVNDALGRVPQYHLEHVCMPAQQPHQPHSPHQPMQLLKLSTGIAIHSMQVTLRRVSIE